jgi:hypothetical protein
VATALRALTTLDLNQHTGICQAMIQGQKGTNHLVGQMSDCGVQEPNFGPKYLAQDVGLVVGTAILS